ncbi:MAG: hypothetical protein P1V97_06695 [Planctomycetota bacterium]|nr:hypothetical protein [Planctomycetota bacterium]
MRVTVLSVAALMALATPALAQDHHKHERKHKESKKHKDTKKKTVKRMRVLLHPDGRKEVMPEGNFTLPSRPGEKKRVIIIEGKDGKKSRLFMTPDGKGNKSRPHIFKKSASKAVPFFTPDGKGKRRVERRIIELKGSPNKAWKFCPHCGESLRGQEQSPRSFRWSEKAPNGTFRFIPEGRDFAFPPEMKKGMKRLELHEDFEMTPEKLKELKKKFGKNFKLPEELKKRFNRDVEEFEFRAPKGKRNNRWIPRERGSRPDMKEMPEMFKKLLKRFGKNGPKGGDVEEEFEFEEDLEMIPEHIEELKRELKRLEKMLKEPEISQSATQRASF